MTLNVTVASPRFIIVSTDRRLTNMSTGKTVCENSTKLTMLRCKDALALISYNGIGQYRGKTPADWLQELDTEINLTNLHYKDVLEGIQEEAERRIATLPQNFDRRHSFVLGAWGRGRTWITVISNYETAYRNNYFKKANKRFTTSSLPEEIGKEVRILVTGSTQSVNSKDLMGLGNVAKRAGAKGIDIKNLCSKMIQNASNKRKEKGSVGSSVLWGIIERFKTPECGLDIPGGSTIHEMPKMIFPGIQLKDVRIEIPCGEPVSWGKPFPLPETQCSRCRNPVPLGYRKCGVCGASID